MEQNLLSRLRTTPQDQDALEQWGAHMQKKRHCEASIWYDVLERRQWRRRDHFSVNSATSSCGPLTARLCPRTPNQHWPSFPNSQATHLGIL